MASDKPIMDVMTITPKQSAEWLAGQDKSFNRSLRPRLVQRYTRDMKAGRWAVNGEPIVFDRKGRLVNGWHRLHACVAAGVPFRSAVVFGVEPEVFDTYDSGGGRSSRDVLQIAGVADSTVVAPLCKWIWRHEQGDGDPFKITGGRVPTIRELEQVLVDHPEVVSCVSPARQVAKLIPRSLAAYLFWLFATRDETLAGAFFDQLATGEGLRSSEPVLLLRERLIANKGAKSRLVERELAALIIATWNALRAGKNVRCVKWDRRNPFPVAA